MGRPRTPYWNLDADLTADLTARGELQTVVDLIARFSMWVDPAIARAVPVVFPKTARVSTGGARQGQVVNGIRYWTNQPAEAAFFAALGTTPPHFTGLVVCHVYPGSPSDPRHFTRLSNLFVIPRTLAAFTEWGDVLSALKARAYELYGYDGPRGEPPDGGALRPRRWEAPPVFADALRATIVARLRHLRLRRPMYSTPGGQNPIWGREEIAFMALPADLTWACASATLDRTRPSPRHLADGACDLDAQFWQSVVQDPQLRTVLLGWIARHSYFAPPAIVKRVPNPFPLTRRARPWAHERRRETIDGVTLDSNDAAWTATVVAIGQRLGKTRGGLVDHAWPGAAYLPAHNAHLGGLVLIPRALGTLADADPVRRILQRHLFEQTGYCGPSGVPPPLPPLMPRPWPETVLMTRDQLRTATITLLRYLDTRPQYFPKLRSGGPGGSPRK